MYFYLWLESHSKTHRGNGRGLGVVAKKESSNFCSQRLKGQEDCHTSVGCSAYQGPIEACSKHRFSRRNRP